MKEILEKTEDNKSARDFLVDSFCCTCSVALANSKYKNSEKLDVLKRHTNYCIRNADKIIENFSNCKSNQ